MQQEFTKSIQDAIQEALEEVHTAMPGKVTDVNTADGTVTVKPTLKYKQHNGEKIDFPEISGVPVYFPQGNSQGTSVVFPVKKGDSCLLVISEQSLEYWQYGMVTDTDLRFDISNAMCIPGLCVAAPSSFAKACSSNAVVVTAGGTALTVAPEGVTIEGTLTVTGDVVGNGVSLSGHHHTCPDGTTSVPY